LESIVTKNVTRSVLQNVTRHPGRPEAARKAEIHFNLARHLPRVDADAGQLRQVVVNLVTNASDALGENAGKITVSTGLMWAEGGELPSVQTGRTVPAGLYVFLEVNDTGCGMDAAMLSRIFDPFFTTKFTGRGLGLAAVIGIVRGHHGSIKVNSRPGDGTTVRVLFPALEEWQPAPLDTSATAPPWVAEGVVLVVEREESICKLAGAILQAAGLTVLTASDGARAIALFREHGGSIRAVLLDCDVPAMDGGDVFEHIRQARPEVKVILCSGYNDEEVAMQLSGRRPAGFLRKPYDPAQLIACLKAVW
jgi:two-component system, cell cycle sensor histidine kinase and response regulator CckA